MKCASVGECLRGRVDASMGDTSVGSASVGNVCHVCHCGLVAYIESASVGSASVGEVVSVDEGLRGPMPPIASRSLRGPCIHVHRMLSQKRTGGYEREPMPLDGTNRT